MSIPESPRSRAALVTGAASGMGAATARALLNEGWVVVAIDLNEIADGSLSQGGGGGRRVLPVQVDVTDRSALEASLSALDLAEVPLCAVVNAAGIYPPSTIDDYTEELYRRVFDTNVLGTLNTIAAALPYIRSHGERAAIVNFASVDAMAVSLGQLVYSASKAAVVAATRYLAAELAPDGIVVNGVAPGWVDTPGNRATGRMTEALKQVPLGRAATPEEVAEWVVRLCDGDSYVTGETLMIAGGVVMR